MRLWGRCLCAVTAGVALAGWIGCGRESAPSERAERLSIAFQSRVGYGPLYLAVEKGFFAEEGLNLLLVDEELDAARRDAFKEGILDAEAGTIDLLVNKRALDTAVVAVAEIDVSLGGDAVVATKEIQSLADLVGKRVALARDDVGETFLGFVLHEAGIGLSELTIVPVSPQKAGQAFLEGEVDAAATLEQALIDYTGEKLIPMQQANVEGHWV